MFLVATAEDDLLVIGSASVTCEWSSVTTKQYLYLLSFGKNKISACWYPSLNTWYFAISWPDSFLGISYNACSKFIFLSSIGAVDRDKKDNCSKELNENSVAVPTTDYGKSKLLIEEFLEKSILETISIRPSLVIGEQMRSNSHFSVFSKKIIKKKYFHILIGLEKCQY